MAYDEGLAQRIRERLTEDPGIRERKMFGGLAFMHRGNLCVGVIEDEVMVRVGPQHHAEALALPHARPMDFTGRPMKGYVFVGSSGIEDEEQLRAWIERGLRFTRTLPSK
jgi:TfoX/Sxy family transcriptional regulator of competence genes